MKKFIILLVGILLLTTGCGKVGKKEVIRDLNKKIQGLKSYYIEGKMEITIMKMFISMMFMLLIRTRIYLKLV